jgi:hypothetical protein
MAAFHEIAALHNAANQLPEHFEAAPCHPSRDDFLDLGKGVEFQPFRYFRLPR